MKEELKKEKSKVEELCQVKNDLEKNVSRVAADLKALREKTEKVSHCCIYFKSHGGFYFQDNGY